MYVINFGHPLTDHQLAQLRELGVEGEMEIKNVTTQLSVTQPIAPQVAALVDAVEHELFGGEKRWQTEPFIVGLPGFAPAAAILLAELAGRSGYLPAFYRLAGRANTTPQVFDVVEIVNLQSVRDAARTRRT